MTESMEARLTALEAEVKELRAREAIRELRARYHQCINEERWEQIPALFAEDGELDFGYLGRARGREKIIQFCAGGPKLLEFVKQFIHNHIIELEGERGTGQSYLEAKSISAGEAYLIAGRYDDEYVCQQGEWRFARMVFAPYFTVPFSDSRGWAHPEKLQMGKRD